MQGKVGRRGVVSSCLSWLVDEGLGRQGELCNGNVRRVWVGFGRLVKLGCFWLQQGNERLFLIIDRGKRIGIQMES